MMGFLDWLLGRPTFHERVARMRRDRDRNWREMMTHWNEDDRKHGSYTTYLPNTKANRDLIFGPVTATLPEIEAELDRIEQEENT